MTAPDTQDYLAIHETVSKYIDGIAESRPELVAEAFHPEATMTGHFSGKYRVTPRATGEHIADFMRGIPPTSEHSPNFDGYIVSIAKYGTMAAVEIAEDQLQGKNFRTFFHLHKVDGQWLISSKATWAPD